MQKITLPIRICLFITVGILLSSCMSEDKNKDLPRESHFKGDKTVVCDTEDLTKSLTMNLRRELIDIAQKQMDDGIAAGSCVTYYKNETIILTNYDNGYYQLHIKGTDDTPKRSFYAPSGLLMVW